MMEYAPTLVMIANRAATGPGAFAYVPGNQKCIGTSAALTANTSSSSTAPVCSRAWSAAGTCGTFTARSAMLSVPVTL